MFDYSVKIASDESTITALDAAIVTAKATVDAAKVTYLTAVRAGDAAAAATAARALSAATVTLRWQEAAREAVLHRRNNLVDLDAQQTEAVHAVRGIMYSA